MIRTCTVLLFPIVLLLSSGHAEAHVNLHYPIPYFPPVARDTLPGIYGNVSGGGTCEVQIDRRGYYLFTNENGSQAEFAYYAPGRLHMISGTWNPNIDVTVSQDRRGRTVIRFQEPSTPAGYWVSQ